MRALAAFAATSIVAVALWTGPATAADRAAPPVGAAAARTCHPRVDGDGAATGDPAPTFTLPTLDHGCVRLAALRGSPVIVNFWASWCNPCRQEFPDLRRAYRQHHAAGLEIVGVTHQDIRSDSRQFAREQHADWTLASDDDGIVAKAYGVRPIPQTIFVRPDGTIAAHYYGPVSRSDLTRELRKISPAKSTASTAPPSTAASSTATGTPSG